MGENSFSEASAAAMLPGHPHERTLRRWRTAGKVPFCRTPGGRIYYTFAQLAEIGAAMHRSASAECPGVSEHARLCPDTSGETQNPSA